MSLSFGLVLMILGGIWLVGSVFAAVLVFACVYAGSGKLQRRRSRGTAPAAPVPASRSTLRERADVALPVAEA